MQAAMANAARHAVQVRRLIPARYVPTVVQRRLDRLWADPAFRQMQEAQMRFLLEYSERAPEIPDLARGYAEQAMLRAHLRWHPKQVTHQRVKGIEWLTTRRDPQRSIVLNFMHHNRYEGLFASLARLGAAITVVTLPEMLLPTTPPELKQHIKVVGMGCTLATTAGGIKAVAELARPGVTLALASDVAGHTPVTFLGRRVLGASGAPVVATLTNSQVVVATHRRDEAGAYVQLDPPIEPADFAGPGELLVELLRRHETAVLAWPEAVDTPRARWGTLDE